MVVVVVVVVVVAVVTVLILCFPRLCWCVVVLRCGCSSDLLLSLSFFSSASPLFLRKQTAAELRHATRDSKAKAKQFQDQLSRLTAKANVGDTDAERLTKQLSAAVAQQEDQRKALRNANTELEALRIETHKLTLELERLRCVVCVACVLACLCVRACVRVCVLACVRSRACVVLVFPAAAASELSRRRRFARCCSSLPLTVSLCSRPRE